MSDIELILQSTRRNETLCLSLAAGLHALMLFWNPIVLKSNWRPAHDFVTVDLVEQPAPGAALPEEKPAKMSLMDTLKDMLMRPKTEEIAHVAPQPVTPKQAAPSAPALKEAARPRFLPTFQPRNSAEDLAASRGPEAIQPGARVVSPLPSGVPSLKTKSYGGIRAKDLPFQVGGDENLAAGGPASIPIAMGNKSAKGALAYTAPALQDTSKRRVGLQARMGSAPADVQALASGSPAPIALAGTPSQAPSAPSAAALQNREGGGRVSAALMGMGRGSYFGSGSGSDSMPSAARQLDTQLNTNTEKSARKATRGFEIAGPLNDRPIIHKVIPPYPSWAEEQGIIGSVRLYFTVTSEGKVRPNITVTKTTGYPRLDQLSIDALRQWQFAPLNTTEEGQWGIITFNFSLSS